MRSMLSTVFLFLTIIVCLSSPTVTYGDPFWQPYHYAEDFSDGELNAWASYPPNQDTAYDPYTYPGSITPGEGNICLVSSCEPPWNEPQRLGAVKRLDCVLDPTSALSFRYYIKSVSACPELAIHLPLETGERIIHACPSPQTNSWQSVTIGWDELLKSFPQLENRENIEITALIIQLTVPDADTDMPVFLGVDDISLTGFRPPAFIFSIPETAILPEFREQVSLQHYSQGEKLKIAGSFERDPESAELRVSRFGDRETVLFTAQLERSGGSWFFSSQALREAQFPKGLYRGVIVADYSDSFHSETSFAFIVEGRGEKIGHPRLVYDADSIREIKKRMLSGRFESVRETFKSESKRFRDELDPATLIYDTNQFPERDWLASLGAWSGNRIRISREALFFNSFAFSLLDDRAAGEYCRELLLKLAAWPQWNHPWMEKRGFHAYYPLGEFALDYAIAYDLCYELLDDSERERIRNALYDNFVEPSYRTYVVDDQVTSNSSNWISHIMGGTLFSLAAMDNELAGDRPVEPLLTGSLMKMYRYISTAFGSDGSYGEGFRYFNFAMQSFAWTLPVIERTYGVDFSGPLKTAHLETLWASNLSQNYAFTFGDSEPFLRRESKAGWIAAQNGPMNSWTWLISRTGDPVLAWLYHELKEYDTLHEVLHDVGTEPLKKPDSLGTVKFFRDVGTAVFKSGWNADDFTFVFRCGPFFNHQHMDQGTFFLSDYGKVFIEERHDGEHHYYDDPVYRSHAIQPVAHNTILIDGNPQSQKTGDPKGFATGMNDQAHFSQWLDSEHFAFVSGSLEGVYPDGPEKLTRSALYIKPRTILMLDEAVSLTDREIDLLFHTKWKKDIVLNDAAVRFHKDGPVLHLISLTPLDVHREIESEPHFLAQFNTRPLIERGYLKLSAQTGDGGRLVMATLMTATPDDTEPSVVIRKDNETVQVRFPAGKEQAEISLRPKAGMNALDDWRSDALVLAAHKNDNGIFAVNCTTIELNGRAFFQADRPVTVSHERNGNFSNLKYYSETDNRVSLAVNTPPESIEHNSRICPAESYDPGKKMVVLLVEPGDGEIVLKF